MARSAKLRWLFFTLYFAEGAPIGFIWWALPTRLRGAGHSVDEITALTFALGLPWALKFAWAPLVDGLRGRVRLRTWITGSQLAMGVTLLPLLWLDLDAQLTAVWTLLLVHAIAAATQDVAVDALCMLTFPATARGGINGWMQAGMLLGRAVFGGALLLVESRLGLAPVVAALVAAIWLALIALWSIRPVEPERQPGEIGLGAALAAALRGARTWLALLYAAVAAAAFEGTAGVLGPYMRDRGLSQDAIGIFYALPGVAAMAAGAVIGGWLADRRGQRLAVLLAQAGVAATVITIAAVDWLGGAGPATVYAAAVVLYVGVGAMTASTYAMLMDVADGPARATAFSAFMAMTNVCELWSIRAVGLVHADAGYAPAFAAVAVVTAAALLLVPRLARPGRAART